MLISVSILSYFAKFNLCKNDKKVYILLLKYDFVDYFSFYLENSDDNTELWTKYMLILIYFTTNSNSITNELLRDNKIYNELYNVILKSTSTQKDLVILKAIQQILFNNSYYITNHRIFFINISKLLLSKFFGSYGENRSYGNGFKGRLDNLLTYLQFLKNYLDLIDSGNLNEYIDLFKLKEDLEKVMLEQNIHENLDNLIKEVYEIICLKYNLV